MTESIGSSTANGLIDYLDSLVAKGRSRPGVVSPLKTAVTKVLEKTEGEHWASVNVIKLDIDDAMARFKNLTMGDYNEASYQAYEARVKRAVSWYKNFLNNPGWFPKARQRATSKTHTDTPVSQQESSSDRETPSVSRTISVASSTEAMKSDEIAYPFPLSNGETARIFMPKNVTSADIKRLTGFLEALVIEKEV